MQQNKLRDKLFEAETKINKNIFAKKIASILNK